MTVLLTLYLVSVLGIWSKHKRHRSKETVRCASLRWCFDSNLQNHLNTEVWNSFLILSCLSVYWPTVGAHAEANLKEIKGMLDEMENKKTFQNSSASLYVPDDENYNLQKCSAKLMYCYLLELFVIANEENENDDVLQSIHTKKDKYEKCYKSLNHGCPECEARLVNPTEFCTKMKRFLQELLSITSKDCN